MAIYRLQRRLYFNRERFNAGIKGAVNGAKNGVVIGSILAPGNLISYATGHKKLAAGLTIGGALLGAGIGGKLGWQKSVNRYDYNHETDPVKLKEREEQNKKWISDQIDIIKRDDNYFYNQSAFNIIEDYKKLENKYNIKFPQDWYKYCKFIINFYKKNYKLWYNAESNTYKSKEKPYLDIKFSEIFPFPNTNEEDFSQRDETMMIGGNLNNTDHTWLFWDFNKKIYWFPLGHGHAGKTLKECFKSFCGQWIRNPKNVDEALQERTKIHNQIINEFLNNI